MYITIFSSNYSFLGSVYRVWYALWLDMGGFKRFFRQNWIISEVSLGGSSFIGVSTGAKCQADTVVSVLFWHQTGLMRILAEENGV